MNLQSSAKNMLRFIDAALAKTEEELAQLRHHRAMAIQLLGRDPKGRRVAAPRAASAQRPRGAQRVDWKAVLDSLPDRFSIADVLRNKDAARKGRLQVDPAISRWKAAKLVIPRGFGVYEKVKRPASQKKAA